MRPIVESLIIQVRDHAVPRIPCVATVVPQLGACPNGSTICSDVLLPPCSNNLFRLCCSKAMIQVLVQYLASRLPTAVTNHSSILFNGFLTTFATWLSWYVWKFSVSPALRPNTPRSLPYYIPCKPFRPRVRDGFTKVAPLIQNAIVLGMSKRSNRCPQS